VKHAGTAVRGGLLTLLNCTFLRVVAGSSNAMGGGARVQTEMMAIDCKFIECVSGVGAGIAIQTDGQNIGFGTFYNCRFVGCWSDYGLFAGNYLGGALGIMAIGGCNCELCHFNYNCEGAISLCGEGTFIDCDISHNRGHYGGIYVAGSVGSSLTIIRCSFSNNTGSVSGSGSHIHFAVANTFVANDCTFNSSASPSILFASGDSETTFGRNCFIGAGRHIESSSDGSISISVTNFLCFEDAESSAISGISFLPLADIRFECDTCSVIDPAPSLSPIGSATMSLRPPTSKFTMQVAVLRGRRRTIFRIAGIFIFSGF
jgi:hypothetical protein